MTQALALRELLEEAGHQVVCVMASKSRRRKLPAYFRKAFGVPVRELASPNFVADKNNKKIRVFASIGYNLLLLPTFIVSLVKMRKLIHNAQPDYVINFHDFLTGIYHALVPRQHHFIATHRSYLAFHPEFPFAPGRTMERHLLKLCCEIMAAKAETRWALSYRPYLPNHFGNTAVVPPLLQDIKPKNHQDDGFYLAYMVNDGYAEDLITSFDKCPPGTVAHCFWDRRGQNDIWEARPGLYFHPLSRKKFLDHLRRCRGVISTAGFETVCEAHLAGKPIGLIPTEGQYEQACNAVDAEAGGIAKRLGGYDLAEFVSYVENGKFRPGIQTEWMAGRETWRKIISETVA
ncbi:glycosyltransferase family protein [Fulvitalea axinellae]